MTHHRPTREDTELGQATAAVFEAINNPRRFETAAERLAAARDAVRDDTKEPAT